MIRVLILCTGNSARSQMAEAVLRGFDPTLAVCSAGTRPAERVHPGAVRALAEIGIDVSGAYPKAVDLYLGQSFDYVITVCGNADQACPAFRGEVGQRLHIGFDDPAAVAGSDAQVMAAFRRVRDEIRTRFAAFYAGMVPLRAATVADVDAVRALLAACALPEDGLAEQFGAGYTVAGGVAACAGVERYGDDGLLRSVAVEPALRGHGLGARLLADRIEWARAQGLRALYLLTTTAPAYFPKAGFHPIGREQAPAAIRESREFAHACPASAMMMRRPL